ncbi:hypothetical protein HZ326_15505 [Fusarium oxysporum f. sp. albedinis]|nr:hypothetical protein HZ326_15505 [Fusarium oxysporum f. sp. albedinis]
MQSNTVPTVWKLGRLGCIQYPGARPVPVGFVSRPSVPLTQQSNARFVAPRITAQIYRILFFCVCFASIGTSLNSTTNAFRASAIAPGPTPKTVPSYSRVSDGCRAAILFFFASDLI